MSLTDDLLGMIQERTPEAFISIKWSRDDGPRPKPLPRPSHCCWVVLCDGYLVIRSVHWEKDHIGHKYEAVDLGQVDLSDPSWLEKYDALYEEAVLAGQTLGYGPSKSE